MMEFITQWHSAFLDTGRIPEILGAMLLTIVAGMVTGPLVGNANPMSWGLLSLFVGNVGDRLDRKERKRSDLVGRGLFITLLTLALYVLLGQMMALAGMVSPYPTITRIVMLSILFTSGAVWFALLRLYFAMEQKKAGGEIKQGAYYAIARTARRDLNVADDFGITRAAMALSARTFDKGLVAPALWYLIGGFPLVMAYSALAGLSWRFGRDGTGGGFAAVSLALEKLLGFIPSLFSSMLLTLAANFTPTARLHKAVMSFFAQKSRAPYAQGGLPLMALAWSLNVSLGGASRDLAGNTIKSGWVGPEGATAKVGHKHLRRAIYISAIAHILFTATLISLYIWGGIL